MIVKGKYRKSFWARLGMGFPKIDKEEKSLIWIHAVSLGETKAIAPLIKKLKALRKPVKILLTTATETGFAEGKLTNADYHYFLPLDFSFLINPIVKKVSPDAVIVVESDFWLNFQSASKRCGAKLILVNGKLSLKSFHRFKKIQSFARALFSPFDLLCLQGDLYKTRFEKLGLSKIEVTGNIKLDSEPPKLVFSRTDLGLTSQDLLLTLGSTHSPEEALFIKYYQTLISQFPHLKICIVPRHPERFSYVAKLLQDIPNARLSEKGVFTQEKKVLLVDKMGVLKSLYGLSDIAFVGGSFVKKVGGHNILEPCYFKVPVLFGPYMHSQPDFLDLMRAYKAGVQVTETTLLPTLQELLSNQKKRKEMGERGERLVQESKGALEKTYESVLTCLKWE